MNHLNNLTNMIELPCSLVLELLIFVQTKCKTIKIIFKSLHMCISRRKDRVTAGAVIILLVLKPWWHTRRREIRLWNSTWSVLFITTGGSSRRAQATSGGFAMVTVFYSLRASGYEAWPYKQKHCFTLVEYCIHLAKKWNKSAST